MNTVVITGASKGIGHATALKFLAAGYQVFNLSRSAAATSGITDITIDLSSADFEAVITAKVLPQIAPHDKLILIHNAAKLASGSLQETSGEALADILALNVTAPQRLNRLFLPVMSAGSAILYVGSTLSEKAVANSFTYVTSKHAMLGMMRATCQDLAGLKIHTACICPGFTDTEMLRAHVGQDPDILESIAGGSAFGRLIEPAEIADLLFFSAENPIINGAVLHGNLGQIES
ncbi:SDR family oxidoreductase [Pseudomonadales bacterium]|nr:SDR family oxidoreductase [Pseudomonadales bacterium]